MTEPRTPQNDDLRPRAGVPPEARFRIVQEDEGGASRAGTRRSDASEPWSAVSRRLLVAQDDWLRHWPENIDGHVRVRASVPLIASLARIRSESDAALALTMVIETLFREARVQLPCGTLDETEIGLVLPADADLGRIAAVIDDALGGQVRATDLQGALRERSKARVEPY
jgi:hypothetical protein